MRSRLDASFYVVAYEPGAESASLPTWANNDANPVGLAKGDAPESIVRKDVSGVPGAYHLLNVLTQEECRRLVVFSPRHASAALRAQWRARR